MQITTEVLKNFAETTVEKLTRVDHSILAAYLTGSLVTEENPLLGGTADIDLIFIHIGEPQTSREILRLTDEVHLDIAHHPQRDYLWRRELRVHPWMGPAISEAIVMYDPQHFLDLTRASVQGLFHQADNMLKRSLPLIAHAREIWLNFQLTSPDPGPEAIFDYLRVLGRAANAIALLGGDPLTERRFLLNFPDRVEAIGRPVMYAGLLGLLGAPRVDAEILASWLPAWETTLDALPQVGRHPRLHPYRKSYYLQAFQAILGSGQPQNILWPLLRTWTLAARSLPESDPVIQKWRDACQHLGLLGPDFAERITALDAYLAQVEEAIDAWARENGA
ncbi:MAG: hypothetical protein ABIG63_10755 [Chloroflexota bacterium]